MMLMNSPNDAQEVRNEVSAWILQKRLTFKIYFYSFKANQNVVSEFLYNE